MRKIIVFIAVLFSFAACDLAKLEPAQTKAFMKYFGDNGNTIAKDLLKLDDGYLLLGNNLSGGIITTVLIKVDRNGNLLWNTNHNNFSGKALAKMNDGYFIIGDGINNINPTRMSLIKTDLNGAEVATTSIGVSGTSYHGTSLTISSLDEIIVCGYIDHSGNTDSTFLYGYDSSLNPTWSAIRKWGSNDVSRISSKTILENSDGDFVWLSLANNGSTNELQSLVASRDNLSLKAAQVLLQNKVITNELGDFNYSSVGGVLVQTVTSTNNAIAMSNYNSSVEISSVLIEEEGNDLYAYSVIQANDGDFVVLGSTNKHSNSSTPRSDLDFYLTKVGIDGIVSNAKGFTNIIGGTGDETGAAIVQADDNGFVFLGTMKNTNDVNLMVLVKVNYKGELIN
jgi:hypothetical protein